jgi:hypothetical protein
VWESVMQALHPALDHPELDDAEMGFPEAKDGNNGE